MGPQSPPLLPHGVGIIATVSSFNTKDEGDHLGLVIASVHASYSEDFEDAPRRNKSPLPSKVYDPLCVT